MSGHEARINDALKQLGEEYRLGMVAAEEYRSRRRMLLESWNERETTTEPGSLKSMPRPQPAFVDPMARTAVAAPLKKSSAPLIVGGVALAVLAAGLWFVFAHRAAPPVATTASAEPQMAPPSAEVVAIRKAADEFLARNAWEAEPIGAFLEQWAALPAADRARALQEPSLRTLRYEVQQNLQAESQLVSADAPPDQRRRLDALTRFAHELGAQ